MRLSRRMFSDCGAGNLACRRLSGGAPVATILLGRTVGFACRSGCPQLLSQAAGVPSVPPQQALYPQLGQARRRPRLVLGASGLTYRAYPVLCRSGRGEKSRTLAARFNDMITEAP